MECYATPWNFIGLRVKILKLKNCGRALKRGEKRLWLKKKIKKKNKKGFEGDKTILHIFIESNFS